MQNAQKQNKRHITINCCHYLGRKRGNINFLKVNAYVKVLFAILLLFGYDPIFVAVSVFQCTVLTEIMQACL